MRKVHIRGTASPAAEVKVLRDQLQNASLFAVSSKIGKPTRGPAAAGGTLAEERASWGTGLDKPGSKLRFLLARRWTFGSWGLNIGAVFTFSSVDRHTIRSAY